MNAEPSGIGQHEPRQDEPRQGEPGQDEPARPSERAPIFNIPAAVAWISLALILVHLGRWSLREETDLWLLREFAYVPGRWAAYLTPHAFAEAFVRQQDGFALRVQLAQIFILHGGLRAWTLLTYGVLHGSLAHLGLNLVWFVAFGAPVARRFGAVRFMLFLVVATVASALAQTIADPFGVEPVIGASGAVSGVTAAALRFVFQPGGSLISPQVRRNVRRVDALPLPAIWRDRQVLGFVMAWLVLNLLFGVFAQSLGLSDQPIAWQAHVGGFAAGLLSFAAFDRRPAPVGGTAGCRNHDAPDSSS